MHSIDVLEEAIGLAQMSGIEVRHEWLAESTGGICRIGTKQVLFVDLSLTAQEQLQQVIAGLRQCQITPETETSLRLRQLLQ